MRRALALAVIVLSLMRVDCLAAERRAITEKDLFRFTWVADPQMSPDGSRVAFVQVIVNEAKDRYESSIWSVSTRGGEPPQRLTTGTRDTRPRWSPDGSRLMFLRSPEKDGKEGKPEPPQLYLLPLTGGEPWKLTDLPKGVSEPAWSPDGKKVALSSTTLPSDIARAERESKTKEKEGEAKDEKAAERESDVRVITLAVYRSNSQGYLDSKRPSHIWTVDVPASSGEPAKPRQITSGQYAEEEPTWSADGSRIYFISTRIPEPYYELQQSDLYSVAGTGGEITKVASINGEIEALSVSRDGKWIAFRGALNQPVRSYTQPDLFVLEMAAGAKPRNLTADFDYDAGGGLIGDQRSPRGSAGTRPLWSRDGRGLIDKVARLGRANLELFDLTSGKVSPFSSGDQEVLAYSASQDGSRLAVLISTATRIGDIFLAEAAGGAFQQLTNVNEKLWAEINITAPEEFWYTSFDGKKMQTWVQKPADFDPAKKYPLILNIHGGPHAAYGHTFDHEFHWMAAKGYVVLYPNPRGSSAYGQDFGNVIQYRYPGDDYKDLMAGVDELIRRGYIDPTKLGVTGGSGGGVLTNWVITQTDRFAAAVSQRSISDWAAWWYTADFTLFHPNWFKAPPWRDPQDYAARSPITNVEKVKTPLMLIEGETDYRTPPAAGGEAMFRALKFLKKPVAMVRFPGETHELSRSGKPWHRVERLQHMVNWFDRYLVGAKFPEYDPVPAGPAKGE